MNWKIFTLVLTLVLAGAAMAQTNPIGLTAKGVKSSLNLSSATGDDAVGAKMTAGFGGGVFATYTFFPGFAVQPEIWYTMKGFKWEWLDQETDIKFTYLEVPILVKVSIPTGGMIKPNVFTGPAFAYLLSAEWGELDFSDNIKDTDFGITFGAGIDHGFGDALLTFDVRYTMSLDSYDDTEDNEDWKHTNLQLVAGYAF
jgi:hypothetical protein